MPDGPPPVPEAPPRASGLPVFLHLLPLGLASLLLAAHFLRFFVLPLVLFSLLVPLLLLLRRTWAVRVLQAWLGLGTLMWVFTARGLVGERLLRGEPWLRLAVILGSVALLTLGAALLLEAPALRRRLRRPGA